jgi:hypothetical protein
LLDILPQVAVAEGMLCTQGYVEWVATCAEFRLEVPRGPPPPRMDLRGLDRLASVDVVGWSQTEGKVPGGGVARVERWALSPI